MMKADDNTEDARVAKSSWFCLSCDKNLHDYRGKVGRHVVWDSIPMKTNNSSTGKLLKENQKNLPTLKR